MIQKIKDEIERLIKNPRLDEEYNPAYQCGLRDLRSFIESLEKEQFAGETMMEKDKIDTAFTRMMEKEQPKRKLRKVCNLREDLKADKPIEERLEELRQIRAEKNRLDEAAEKAGLEYAPKREGEAIDLNGDVYATDDVEWPSRCGFIKGFKAGAKWMAEQGVSKEAEIEVHGDVGWLKQSTSVIDVPDDFKDGDTVIVQVRKKEDK